MKKEYRIENCANSVESAVKAQEGGAYRVELCAGIPEGGTTPSMGEIVMARKLLDKARLHVIIRPRGGDFLYNAVEQEIMLQDIRFAKEAGADGVVVGCLTADGDIDCAFLARMMHEAEGMSVTFHRAFDMCRDPEKALEQLIAHKCNRVLTSGQQSTAEAGIPLLKQLVAQADGRIIIMPGCGVNAENIRRIADETGACEFHFSGRIREESGMNYRNTQVSMGGCVKVEEYSREITDPAKVRTALEALLNP